MQNSVPRGRSDSTKAFSTPTVVRRGGGKRNKTGWLRLYVVFKMANVQVLIEKMGSADKDYRYMACNDLIKELQKPEFKLTERLERKVRLFLPAHKILTHLFLQLVEQLLKLLEDTNGEVQSLAVKWYLK